MPSYSLPLFGLEISFSTDADPDRVRRAKEMIESRYERLERGGVNLSREKILAFLVLALADDYLLATARLEELETRIDRLLRTVDLASPL